MSSGHTRQQTLSVLTKIKAQLESMGLGMGDVVKMTVFLVGVPEKGGRMDSAARNEASFPSGQVSAPFASAAESS